MMFKMKPSILLFCVVCFACVEFSFADCDNLQDVCPTATTAERKKVFVNGYPCKNPADVSASDFKSSELKNPSKPDIFVRSSVKLITALDYPGLNTLGLAVARTDIESDGLVVPHSHPRATEIVFVFKGDVIAGFIDTQNNVFQTVLKQGDVFVFPRGLLHFCVNAGFERATLYSVFNSQNPGVVNIGGGSFGDNREEINKFVRNIIANSTSDGYPTILSRFGGF